MRFYRTNEMSAVAVLLAACSLQGCGDEQKPRPVDPGSTSSSSGGVGGEGTGGAQGGNGGAGTSSSGMGGMGGMGGAISSSSSSSGMGGMGGMGGAISSSSGMGGMGGQGGSSTAICGDGIISNGEACDDKGTQSGDGCAANCTIESGYACMGAPSVCADINECLMNNGGCSMNATCTNTPGSRTCACNMGFTGNGITCTDINECLMNNGGCSMNATCTNMPGSRTCTCNMGYAGDGITCTDINECLMNNGGCSMNATCTNTPGSRTCVCNSGYAGDGITCTATNPCSMNNGGCSANATCSFANNMVSCACNMGYTGDGITCTDIDECLTNNGGCSMNATCTNTPGSRTCACNTGYSGNGVTCTDIDECLTNNGGCSMNATCTNTPGSRTCACKMGFTGDGITCMDINECLTNNGGCSMNATCTNTPGSRTCACNMGYMGDGITCTDINECATNNGGCLASQTCVNSPGTFTCVSGCTTDPAGISTATYAIGPSESMAALCNAQALVGNQSLNRLEIRTSTGALGTTYALPDKPFDIAYDMATDTAYTTLLNTMAATTDLVRVNLSTGAVTSIPIGGIGLRVVIGNNGIVFVTMSDALTFPNRPIALVNGTNATLIKTLLVPYGGSLMAFDRAANLLYLADEGASPSKLERYGFDPVGQTLTLAQSRSNAGNNGVDLAISPDGLHVAFSCSQGNATNPIDYKLHDINAADLNATFGMFTTGQYPTAAAFSPNNTRLMATNGSTMRRFDVATHSILSENVLQPCTNGSVRRIAVSPGGTLTYVLTKCGTPATSGILSRIYYP